MPSSEPLLESVPIWALLCLLGLLGAIVGRWSGALAPLYAQRLHLETPVTAGSAPSYRPERRTGGNVVRPACCPRCDKSARLAKFAPLPSLLTCTHCGASFRAPPVLVWTMAGAFAMAGLACFLQDRLQDLPALLWFAAVALPLATIDIRVLRLPTPVIVRAYPGALFLITAAILLTHRAETGEIAWGEAGRHGAQALVAMLCSVALYWLLWRINPRGLGYGDVRLSGLTGLYIGWAAGPLAVLPATFITFLVFIVSTVFVMIIGGTRKRMFPLGSSSLVVALLLVAAAPCLAV
jgi:leader peptidase (prepilin peptidase)/N-methyltransferase